MRCEITCIVAHLLGSSTLGSGAVFSGLSGDSTQALGTERRISPDLVECRQAEGFSDNNRHVLEAAYPRSI